MGNCKPQFAVTRLQFHVAESINFRKTFSSVQFIFISQNTIPYKNTYKNCKVAREPMQKKPEET